LFCQISFYDWSSFAFPKLDFLQSKAAFYLESRIFSECSGLSTALAAAKDISFLKLTSVPILWNHRMRT